MEGEGEFVQVNKEYVHRRGMLVLSPPKKAMSTFVHRARTGGLGRVLTIPHLHTLVHPQPTNHIIVWGKEEGGGGGIVWKTLAVDIHCTCCMVPVSLDSEPARKQRELFKFCVLKCFHF